mmetsp:Transcript_37035/g.87172  ORF Transcript_37035/g.87172 Transcript_37035/m.87172 type:complete len:256 (+) Transcript_37035:1495-2262(+)
MPRRRARRAVGFEDLASRRRRSAVDHRQPTVVHAHDPPEVVRSSLDVAVAQHLAARRPVLHLEAEGRELPDARRVGVCVAPADCPRRVDKERRVRLPARRHKARGHVEGRREHDIVVVPPAVLVAVVVDAARGPLKQKLLAHARAVRPGDFQLRLRHPRPGRGERGDRQGARAVARTRAGVEVGEEVVGVGVQRAARGVDDVGVVADEVAWHADQRAVAVLDRDLLVRVRDRVPLAHVALVVQRKVRAAALRVKG